MDDLSQLITLISYANSVYSSGMQLAGLSGDKPKCGQDILGASLWMIYQN